MMMMMNILRRKMLHERRMTMAVLYDDCGTAVLMSKKQGTCPYPNNSALHRKKSSDEAEP